MIFNAWMSDDAYHAYIMAKHLVDGNGFVYNIGYRVNVSTCPLYTLITALFYLVSGKHMYFAGMFQCIVFSMSAVVILLFKFCKRISMILFTTVMLISSYSFMSYTTAGLENCLLFLLHVLFCLYFLSDEITDKTLFILSFIYSLILMTRMDNALIMFFPLFYVFVNCKTKLFKKLVISFAGIFPFIVWICFSLLYYGYPFPNTFYSKIASGITRADYFAKGFDYFYRSFTCDIVLPLCFILALYLLRRKCAKHVLIMLGIFWYCIYLLYVGGDFMVGRHFTVLFFCSLIIICDCDRKSPVFDFSLVLHRWLYCLSIGLMIMWATVVGPLFLDGLYDAQADDNVTTIADEPEFYYTRSGLIPTLVEWFTRGDLLVDTFMHDDIVLISERASEGGQIVHFLCGFVKYYVEDDFGNINYLTDSYALMDGFLSHLPVDCSDFDWRIGHLKRDIPEGYYDSVTTGDNCLVDDNLRQYYDLISLIETGNLFDIKRLRVIVDMNLGYYDYLLE